MSWECAVCNTREDQHNRIDAVCHHCGKPLCRGDRMEIADYMFTNAPGRIGQAAWHCKQCKDEHHRTDVPLGEESQ